MNRMNNEIRNMRINKKVSNFVVSGSRITKIYNNSVEVRSKNNSSFI